MTDKIIEKIRSLIEDFGKADFHIFSYTNSNTFSLPEPNITSITNVLINGNPLQSGESYDYDEVNNQITIDGVDFTTSHKIEVDYIFNEYSDSNIKKFITASLVWLSIFGSCAQDYEFEDDDIYPSPDNKTCDLIAIISSILIKPDYHEYRLKDSLVVKCPQKIPKEDKIEQLIEKFNTGVGAVGLIEIEIE